MFITKFISNHLHRLVVISCCILSFSAAAKETMPAPDHKLWDSLLKSNVMSIPNGKSTQVDYAEFVKAQSTLETYLNSLSAVDQTSFDKWNKADQLAFLLNAYNAWTIKLVLKDHSTIESIKDLGSLLKSPWKKEFIPLFGKTQSLDDIEHGLIRGSGRYAEPRIHFAANCASIGCPALREEAYVGHKLESQLEQQTQRFLSDVTHNRLEANKLALSSIFNWYRGDFEAGWRGTNSLEEFLALYAKPLGLSETQVKQLKQKKIDIDFLDYDWRLNRK